METLRIAHVLGGYEPDRGGVARFVSEVAETLGERGHHVEVLSLGPASKSNRVPCRAFNRQQVYKGELWTAVRDGHFDIVHVHSYSSFVPLKALPGQILARARRVLTPHFHAVGSYPAVARRLFDLTVGRTITRYAEQIHVDTPAEREGLLALQHLPSDRFFVVPPPLSKAFSNAPPATVHSPPSGTFRVLFVGRLDPQKRVDVLLEALSRLPRRGSTKVKLTIVGRDYLGYGETVRGLASTAALDEFELLGAVSDVELRGLYDQSHALALLSRYEAFGIVLLEAMSRGLPVLAARSGGMPYLINHDRDGLLVPYGDVAATAAALGALRDDGALWSRLSKGGIERAREYTPDRSADLTLAAYAQLLIGPSSARAASGG